MSRRRIALLLLLACGIPLGGWLVVGPAVATRKSTAPEPPMDLDAPMLTVSLREAAASSAHASAVASSPAGSGATDDTARCGEDQAPVYGTLQPEADGAIHGPTPVRDADGFLRFVTDEVKPAGVGYAGAMRRVDAALRSSGDPFDIAVADALNVDDVRSPRERLAVLVQEAATSHDARIETLGFSACSQATQRYGDDQAPMPGSTICAALDVRQWAQDDPGNGVPWLYALRQADQKGDSAAQHDALLHLASATRFTTGFGMASASVARVHLASDADLAAQAMLAQLAMPLELGSPYSSLTSRCRSQAGGDPAMAVTCDAIANQMMEHTDGLMTRAVGGSIHKLATGDASRLDEIHREMGDYGKRWAEQADEAPCSSERQILRHMVQVGERGEVALMKQAADVARMRPDR